MGTFSWLKAERTTKVANVVESKPFKLLIPKEFGGGFIKDNYQGYGYIGRKEDGSPKYDIYELLAFWNSSRIAPFERDLTIREKLRYEGEFPNLKEIDKYTDYNSGFGVDISETELQMKRLKYPLKLVSASYKGTYEECEGISIIDYIKQGSESLSWEEVDNY